MITEKEIEELAEDWLYSLEETNPQVLEKKYPLIPMEFGFKEGYKAALQNKVSEGYASLPIDEIIGADQPWPLSDILNKLIQASEILLHKKSYDGHGYEEISHAVKRAKEISSLFKPNCFSKNKVSGLSAEEIVEESFKGLSDLIEADDIVDWYKRLIVTCIVNERKAGDVSSEIGENEYLDLTVLNENDKAEFIKQIAGSCAKELLKTFLGFGLNNFIEIMVTNDTDKKEYILTFQTKEQFEKRFKEFERKDNVGAFTIEDIREAMKQALHYGYSLRSTALRTKEEIYKHFLNQKHDELIIQSLPTQQKDKSQSKQKEVEEEKLWNLVLRIAETFIVDIGDNKNELIIGGRVINELKKSFLITHK